jgi:hypothetical protein
MSLSDHCFYKIAALVFARNLRGKAGFMRKSSNYFNQKEKINWLADEIVAFVEGSHVVPA